MPAKTTKPTEHTFETAIERLEQIVDEMEGDKLPLEQLLQRYEEGTKLAKICQDTLDAAEKRIEIISRAASGRPQLAELEPAAAASAPEPPPRAPAEEVSLF
jgi:exodeoxyribonuclease VII small subunit